MSAKVATNVESSESIPTDFEVEHVLTVAGGHFISDTYTAFLAPLLPQIMQSLSISLTLAGSLSAILQFPAVLNPLIGYIADKINLRYLIIFTPAITGTLISMMGLAPNYFALAILLFVTGISVAGFHAPAPAMVAAVSHRRVGKGMSIFMAAGELGRTIGPLLAVWAVSVWSLEGIYHLVVLGWAASIVLFFRLRKVSARPAKPGSIRSILPAMRNLYLPLAGVMIFRNFMIASLTVYLPTYMGEQGASLWVGGSALSILEVAGVAGALTSGTISDRLGRRTVLLAAMIASTIGMLLFLSLSGWLVVPVLLWLGFTALSSLPVMMAIVQDYLPNNRAIGNGFYMLFNFLLQSLAVLAVGYLGETYGLKQAFTWSAWAGLLAAPAILSLPGKKISPVKSETV